MLPEWLAIKPAATKKYKAVRQRTLSLGLATVCAGAHCPNMAECWGSGTATFMVLGDTCTRGCRFCAVKKGAVGARVDASEPEKLGKVISDWKLGYVVLTSVCRDDLQDQGASHFAACIGEIKKRSPGTTIEVLMQDFRGETIHLRKIVDAHPDVIGHNVETVERLTPEIRDRRAGYLQSLGVLRAAKLMDRSIYTKSSLMLGFGEAEEEILATLKDLRVSGVDFLALGQYLRPTPHHAEVREYVRPEKFEQLRIKAQEMGFLHVASGPFVRSSYKAGGYFADAHRPGPTPITPTC